MATPTTHAPTKQKALRLPLEAKDVTEDGVFEGYLAVFGEEDREGDVVERGAFKETLREKGRERPLLWQHDPREPIGQLTASEDDHGLRIVGELNLDVQRASEAHTLLEDAVIDGLSQGYDPLEYRHRQGGEGRVLTKIDLWEGSLVTFPAQPAARVDEVRDWHPAYQRQAAAREVAPMPEFLKEDTVVEVKTVVQYQDLSLASEGRDWDGDAARQRLQEWAADGTSDPDPSEIDFSEYRRGFVWYDGDEPEQVTSYKLPIADVISGNLQAVPAGIQAAANAVQGARGGVDVPEDSMSRIRGHLARYFEKMDETPPWEDDGEDDAGLPDEARGALADLLPPDA